MKNTTNWALLAFLFFTFSCSKLDDFIGDGHDDDTPEAPVSVDFRFRASIQVGGEGAAEISAFDPLTNKLFVVNVEVDEVSVFDITDIDNPIKRPSLTLNGVGKPNSVSVSNGKLAVAVEAFDKQANGYIKIYDTETLTFLTAYGTGALPDMVTFSPDGKYLVSANEGEPNNDYTNDPYGSITIVNIDDSSASTISFSGFESQLNALKEKGFRVFGPNASLAMDVEPEYVAVSEDSKTAWVTLQENNGVAKVNLEAAVIEAIYPLGFKDHSLPGNEIDPSNKDDQMVLANYPVFGIYQPDAIAYVMINRSEYIITANEGDAREYDGDPGFVEEERIKDILLDSIAFPNYAELQEEEVLGRLKITTTLGDPDGDGFFNQLFSYGARSFTIWTADGAMVYDSGSEIARKTLELTPDVFNGGDSRSDDKGAEPESVEVLKVGDRYLLFVGLERNDQVMVYDISDPSSPKFLDLLSNAGDEGPEGLLAIPAAESPTGKDLLVVSNEDTGGVTFYEN